MATDVTIRAALLAILVAGCESSDDMPEPEGPVTFDLAQPMPEKLSSLNAVHWDAAAGQPVLNSELAAYDLNSPLFSDYAVKYRAVYVPPGAVPADFNATSVLDFPVGTVLFKSFVFPADLRAPTTDATIIETRLLVHQAGGWEAFPYVWNSEQTDAILAPAGGVRSIDLIDAQGASLTASYLIPQKNQCASCHARLEEGRTVMSPIGTSARQLHRNGQLERLADAGVVQGVDLAAVTPAFDFSTIEATGVPTTEVDRAARDYLDGNCAHCHNPNGVQGTTSQLFLDHASTDQFRLGICKQPGSAGLGTGGFKYDIVPGNADISILAFRITTTEPGAIMPLLGRSLVHMRGTELVRAWINAMPPSDPPNCGL